MNWRRGWLVWRLDLRLGGLKDRTEGARKGEGEDVRTAESELVTEMGER